MEKVFAGLASIIAVVTIIWPFFRGQGGVLAAASAVDDEGALLEAKIKLAKRWAKDEAAHASGEITDREWDIRKELLTNRFLDHARRLDFLRGSK